MPTKTTGRPIGRPRMYDKEVKAAFTDEQIARIDRRAGALEVPRAEVVRRAVDKYLEEK